MDNRFQVPWVAKYNGVIMQELKLCMAVTGTRMDMIKHNKLNLYCRSYHDLKHVCFCFLFVFTLGLYLRERVDAFLGLASRK